MDDDLKAVVERLEARASSAEGFSSVVTGREIYVPLADLRTLLSALRQRDEALDVADTALRDYACCGLGTVCLRTADECATECGKIAGEALDKITILAGSETNAR
mgnify:CR=1 FL=1